MRGFVSALTSFVGRDDEVAEVAALLGEYRLVTVTGPGGMGKTRLAGEVARAVAPRFADGAWLVELAAVRDPGQVAAAVAARLGVPKDPGRSITEALVTVLGRQQFTWRFVIEVLIESGDLAAARRGLADSLAWMREAADRPHQATTLALLADLELRAGNITESGRLLHEATDLAVRSGADDRLFKCLDVGGHLCAVRGQPAEAVTIWTAFCARLEAEGTPDMPLNAQRRQEPLARTIQALGPAGTQAARERGAAMTLATAAEFVLMASGADGQAGPVADAPPGLAQLSAREQELIGLVAKGCTDAEIAGQLYIAVSTVRSHLDRIRDKTSCRRRADLTRLALQAGLA
jgi:DNA-binding CsgD family transcriptional regulator